MYELDGEGRPESWATHCMQWMRLPLRQRCYYSSPSQPSSLSIIINRNAQKSLSEYETTEDGINVFFSESTYILRKCQSDSGFILGEDGRTCT